VPSKKQKTPPKNVRAILFDMDGVIMDSMDMHYRLWRQIFSEYGVQLTRLDVYLREGEKAEKSIRRIFALRKKKMAPGQLDEMFQKKKRLMREKRYQVKVFPGVRPFLRRLQTEGIHLALVTGTRRRFLN